MDVSLSWEQRQSEQQAVTVMAAGVWEVGPRQRNEVIYSEQRHVLLLWLLMLLFFGKRKK